MMLTCIIEYFIVKSKDRLKIEGYQNYLTPLYNNTQQYCPRLNPSKFKDSTNFLGNNVEYSSSFICILTGFLGILYQRVNYKG